MKKQRKQLIILVIILLLLIAGYFGVKKYNEVKSSSPEDDSVELVFDLSNDSVSELSYQYEGEVLTFIKEDAVWKYKEDTSLSIIQTSVENMISAVTQLESQGKIETVVEVADYGLDEPEQKITFVADGISYEIWLGDYNSMTSVYYITTDGGKTVHAVESTLSTAFDYALDELVEEESAKGAAEEPVVESVEESTEAAVEEETTTE